MWVILALALLFLVRLVDPASKTKNYQS